MRITVKPTDIQQFKFESVRLASALHSHMMILKGSPSSQGLKAFETSIATKMASSIAKVSQIAYNAAALQVNQVPLIANRHTLIKESLERARLSASLMSTSSAVPLEIKSAVSKARVASMARAEFASNYELRLAFFLGTTRGWELNKNAKKGWVVSSAHDMDDVCDDNADQGLISVFDFFDSGVMYAPAHIGCTCDMYVYLKEDN